MATVMQDMLATQPAAGEPIGKIVSFGPRLHEVAWSKGKLPPLGTELYTAPPAAAHGDEAVRKDAERFEWLISNVCMGSIGFGDWWMNADEPASEWRAAIDAAMRAQGDGEVE